MRNRVDFSWTSTQPDFMLPRELPSAGHLKEKSDIFEMPCLPKEPCAFERWRSGDIRSCRQLLMILPWVHLGKIC